MSTQNCVTLFIKNDSIMFDSLSYMLSDNFMNSLRKIYDCNESVTKSMSGKPDLVRMSLKREDLEDEDSVEYLVNEYILLICQILCFPFAIDPNEEVISRMYSIIKDFNLFIKILNACIANAAHLTCDIPFSLIARLVLTDEDLVQLLIDQLNSSNQLCEFLNKLLYSSKSSDSLIADILSILSHLSRKSEDSVGCVMKILRCPVADSTKANQFPILTKCLNGQPIVRSRCCNLIGNLMKHNDVFYEVLRKNKPIFEDLAKCCQTDELNVRKVNFVSFIFDFCSDI